MLGCSTVETKAKRENAEEHKIVVYTSVSATITHLYVYGGRCNVFGSLEDDSL